MFELSGARAKSIGEDSIFHCMKVTLTCVKENFLAMNIKFLLLAVIIVTVGMFLIIRHKANRNMIIWILSILIMLLYLVLSCSKAGSQYIRRPDVFYGIFFFSMLIIINCGMEIMESNVRQLEPEIRERIDQDILNQLLEAEKAGQKETVLYVPVFEAPSKDNWPIATYAYNRIPMQPYKYGALKEKITVTEIIPIYDKNMELHVDVK